MSITIFLQQSVKIMTVVLLIVSFTHSYFNLWPCAHYIRIVINGFVRLHSYYLNNIAV